MKRISMKKVIYGLIFGVVLLSAACEISTGTTPGSTTPFITSIVITPDMITIGKGKTKQFSAVVYGTHNPVQTVIWDVEGGTSSNTSITSLGLLTVADNETSATLTIRAKSTVEDKNGTATVKVAENSTGDDSPKITDSFLSDQNVVDNNYELVSVYLDTETGYIKGLYKSGSIKNQLIAYKLYHYTGNPRDYKYSLSLSGIDEHGVSSTITNSVQIESTWGVSGGFKFGKDTSPVQLNINASYQNSKVDFNSYTTVNELKETKSWTEGVKIYFDTEEPGWYLFGAYNTVDYYVEAIVDPKTKNVIKMNGYYGIKSYGSYTEYLYSVNELRVEDKQKLVVNFVVDTSKILAAVGNLPKTEFYWTSSRADKDVGYKNDGFLGIGNYDDQLRDSITLGNEFNYSDLKKYDFKTAIITVDTDIREIVDTYVHVSILKSNGDEIGSTQTFDPDGNNAFNTWKDHYIYFSRNVNIDDIKDGKFIILYSARGHGDNKYRVGKARVTVKML